MDQHKTIDDQRSVAYSAKSRSIVSGRSIKTSRAVARSDVFKEPNFIDKRVSNMKERDLREPKSTNPLISPAGTHRVIYHRKNIDDYPDPNLPTRSQEL